MKKLIFACFLIFGINHVFAQISEIDSLKHQLTIVKQDTSRALILAQLSYLYRNSNADTSLIYAQEALGLAQKIRFAKAEVRALNSFGFYFRVKGDLPKALNYQNTALGIAEREGYLYDIAVTTYLIGVVYLDFKDYDKAINIENQALKIFERLGNKERKKAVLLNMAVGYRFNNQPQLSFNTLQKVRGLIDKTTSKEYLAFYFSELGTTQVALGNHKIGFETQKKAATIYKEMNNLRRLSAVYNTIALDFDKLNQLDSGSYYAQKGLLAAESIRFKREILIAAKLLAKTFELKDSKKAIEYYKIAMKTNDELYGTTNFLNLQKIVFEEQEKQRKTEIERLNAQSRLKQYVFLTLLLAVSFIGFIFYRNNRQKQKANAILEKTLTELRTTQNQLIQKEKLASLGELTAGIAHEIQNPLNFVNNFSELSGELLNELKSPLTPDGGIRDGEKIDMDLMEDLTQNLEKINLHGKRASSIVKGMLEHSRTATGERQLTDINQLADEYLRLSYHGLRAKNKDFNADYELITDKNLSLIKVVPQEIGRVLLNLLNNAFYAVNERTKQGEANYQPKVTVTTKVADNQLQIRIADNGLGIPDAIKAKIFQPFFTTKPTGEGTGLGLSLAYDIVTKGYSGAMEVESVVGEGTTFVAKLPLTIMR